MTGRHALRLVLPMLLIGACDLKSGGEETKAPTVRRSRGKQAGKSDGLEKDPAVVQAVAELERTEALHVRVVGAAEPVDEGRSPAAMLRRGAGKIAPERVHVASGEGGAAGVRFEFFVPEASAGPPVSDAAQ